jgi:Flp pilus assembly protein TadD
LHRAGEIKDARKAIEKTISLRPDFAPAYMAISYMQLLGNDNEAARRIRFTPAMRDGKPVSVIGSLEFAFNLY